MSFRCDAVLVGFCEGAEQCCNSIAHNGFYHRDNRSFTVVNQQLLFGICWKVAAGFHLSFYRYAQ